MGRKRQTKINADALRAEKTDLVLKYLCTQNEVSKADKEKALKRVKEIREMLDTSERRFEEEVEADEKPKRKTKIKRKKL